MRQTPYFGPESGGMTLAEIMALRRQHWCPACKVFVFVCDHWIALRCLQGDVPEAISGLAPST
jgi:hypothetical protein